MPFAYKIGATCKIVVIEQTYPFYFSVGITWAILLPLSFYLYHRFKELDAVKA